ncbi:sorting nexin-29 isoform X2 [Anabrus simplex]|uniref:sorting nexin-29 isoform X2 n=1 Tax=Anabrus simplex TaxID=316456 RepID=UPI0035A37456
MSTMVQPAPSDTLRAEERQQLLSELLDAVKQCQIRFGGRAELATESDPRIAILCSRLEAVLSHGLRSKLPSKNNSAFRQVTEIVSSSLHLSKGQPPEQPGLGSILFAISIDNKDLNQEYSNYDGVHLIGSEPIIPAAKDADFHKKRGEQRHRKRVQPQIISFDDDSEVTESQQTGSLCNKEVTVCPSVSVTGVTQFAQEAGKDLQSPDSSDQYRTSKNADSDNIRPTELGLSHPTQSSSPLENAEPVLPLDARNTCISSSIHMRQHTQTLTPVNNVSVGELIPVSLTDEAYSEEDSLSVPSYSEDTECAAAALLATQRLLQTNCVDFSSKDRIDAGNHIQIDATMPVNGEIHEAWVNLKEELQAETRLLQKLLEKSEDLNTHLEVELTEATRQYNEKAEKMEARIQSLVRENELLKHQLRKYVGAVQMLKRDGSQAHEALASLEGTQPKIGENLYPDYHYEAREYEKKLIQVAEMHGELMEFNDRLHRLLQVKDSVIRRLREELVDLRGPLPDDVATSDDDISVTSDYDNSSSCAAARALINIWIPSAFLTGGSSDVHHVYQVFIRIRDDEWNIYRRYAQFYALHKELKKQNAVVATFDFPPKKTLGNKDARFVEERRRRLQHYLRCVMNQLVQTNTELASSPDKELLIGLMPFFGETCNVEDKSRRKRGSARNPFSRLARNTEGTQNSELSPQYTGL